MAANNIEFKIGSSFSGEGFANANKAIQQNQKEIQSSIRGLGELTNAVGEISPEAGKAVSAIGGLAKAFAAGGITGGAIQLAVTGISEAIKFTVEKWKEADEIVRKVAASMRDDLLKVITDGNTRTRAMTEEMKQATSQAQALALAMGQATSSEARQQIHKVNIEKLQQITDDMTAEARAVVEAEAAFKIAVIKGNSAVELSAQKLSAASATLDHAVSVRKEAELAAANATKMLQIALQDSTTTEEQLKALRDAERVAVENATRAVAAEEQARLNQIAAADANTAAIEQKTLMELEATMKLTEAQNKQTASLEAGAEKAKELAEKQEEAAAEFSNYIAELKAGMESEIASRKANDELTAQRNKIAEEIKSGKTKMGVNINVDGSAIKEPIKTKVENAGDIGSSAFAKLDLTPINKAIDLPRGLKPEVAERIRQGVANVADLQQLARYQERAKHDRENAMNRIKADSAQYVKILNKAESWRSTADRKFMDTFESKVMPKLGQDLVARLLGDASKRVMCREDLRETLQNEAVVKAWSRHFGCQ